MRIVMFSINPLFAEKVMGGAPKHLQNVAIHLGKLGHEVKVLCTQRDEAHIPFSWGERVEVLPILRFKQPFPQPYAIPAYDMAAMIQDMSEYLAQADRFYMHDGEFLYPYVYRHVPTVVSLRDNVYPETLLGGFLFQGDSLILISHYARQYFEQTVGRFFLELPARIKVVRNGLDWSRFKPTAAGDILKIIPVNPQTDRLVLHPHRPEETKGIRQTIDVIDRLVYQYQIKGIKTLVPRWIDAEASEELRLFYREIDSLIAERGLKDNFVFHDWIPQALMPEYFSMGAVTLALGNFVESFGNAVYESLGCGTPVVVSRISSHRELLPENLVDKVDFDDAESAAAYAARIITNRERTRAETLTYLHQHYSIEQQLEGYAAAILNAKVVPEMRYKATPRSAETRYILPVWCYEAKRGIYHDFRSEYHELPQLADLLRTYPSGFTVDEAAGRGIEVATVEARYRDGYITHL